MIDHPVASSSPDPTVVAPRRRWRPTMLVLGLAASALLVTADRGAEQVDAAAYVEAVSVVSLTAPASATQPAVRQGRHVELPVPPPGKIPFPVEGGSGCFIYWSSFGQPRAARSHEGTDIMGIAHQPVYAVVDGKLTHRYTNTGTAGWGWTLVDDNTGIIYKYFHLAADPASRHVGDQVRVGDVIGFVGDSGTTVGNFHLHFEVRPNNVPMQPLQVLDVRNCNVR